MGTTQLNLSPLLSWLEKNPQVCIKNLKTFKTRSIEIDASSRPYKILLSQPRLRST